MSDVVNHPAHYTFGGIEVLDVIEDWNLNYHLGNSVKYLARAGRKAIDKAAEDLKKAAFYFKRHWKLRNDEAIRPLRAQVPPFTLDSRKYDADDVVKAWGLDVNRAQILRAIFDGGFGGLTIPEAIEALAALTAQVEAKGAKEVLCLSDSATPTA